MTSSFPLLPAARFFFFFLQLLLHLTSLSYAKAFNVIVVGGSSGMGKAAAIAAVRRGGNALIVSRSPEKLEKASKEISTRAATGACREKIGVVSTAILDASNELAVEEFACSEQVMNGEWDGLVFSAAGRAPHGPIDKLDTSSTRDLMNIKFWGAYHTAKHIGPKLRDGGCCVFVSGVLNRRPGINCSPLACTNGALEGLTRSLALEFGPRIRVNCMSPGFCDTERFDHMEDDRKKAMLENTADSLPLKRVGQPEDMGEAIYYLLTAPFVTGVVLDVDGGHGIRQYANPNSDPMRKK